MKKRRDSPELATDLERKRSKCIHDYNYLKTGHEKNQEPEIRKEVAFHERNKIGKWQRFYETTIQFNQPPVEFSEVIDLILATSTPVYVVGILVG